MISSEMPELIGMSDRIMVMCEGRVTGFVDSKPTTQEEIMSLATKYMSGEGLLWNSIRKKSPIF